ncbi:efflux RND transporter periplasmic adaptor subunit [Undibacterium arcticum]|uniref:Efflux RND transporter periplasmic adaptor subunit n=1 Tax=Undibacterium arcticum TaxID=1762892 RepID=A0ABV7F153_9BURK
MPVVVAQVERRQVPLRIEAVGSVETIMSVAIKSRIDGEIAKVKFHDGDAVSKGQLLFEIDPRPAQAQLNQAKANLARDTAQLHHAQDQDVRYQDLLNKHFISADAYSQIRTALESARAVVAADMAAVESAKLQLDYSTIRAPIAGRVGKTLIQAGNLVKANDVNSLVIINQIHPIYVNFAVSELQIERIRAAMTGGPLAVEVSTLPGSPGGFKRTSRLAFLDNAVDPATGTVKLRAEMQNADAAVWPGQFVHAALLLGNQQPAVVVSSTALQNGPNGTFVYLLDPATKIVQPRDIAVDRIEGPLTVVAKGLAPGETVVVDGQSRLAPGAAVSIKSTASGS